MTSDKLQQLLTLIEKIKSYDWDQKLAEKYPDIVDPRTIDLGKQTADSLFVSLGRALKQLEAELTSDAALYLPIICNISTEYPNVNLENELTTIDSYISQAAIPEIVLYVERLIHYQIVFGFWDKSAARRSKSILDYEAKFESLKVIENKIDRYIQKIHSLEEQSKLSKDEVDNYLVAKRQEYSLLTSNQQASSNLLADMQQIVSNIKVAEANFVNTKDSMDKILLQAEKTKGEIEQTLSELSQKYKEELAALNIALSEEKKELTNSRALQLEVIDAHDLVEQKKQQVIEMVKFIADVSMGHSFDTRQRVLSNSAKLWMWLSLGMMILSLGWLTLPAFFPKLLMLYPDSWMNLVAYAGKSAVVFIILGFVIRQYSKERALQEEYAFKTAISLTMSAYTDQISGEMDEFKRKIIMDTVERMYTLPRIHRDPSNGLFGLRTKTIENITAKVVESIKDIIAKK